MPSGLLKLMFEGVQSAYKPYDCTNTKNVILTQWKKLYGPMFKRCHVIDNENPDLRTERKINNLKKKNSPAYGSLNNFGGKVNIGQKTRIL